MSIPQPTPTSWAVVTGASAGIGAELTRELASRGHNVILVARRLDRLEALAAELRQRFNVQAEAIACDLADPAARAALCDQLSTRTISVLCNNAGFATFGDLRAADPQCELGQIEVNVNAVAQLTFAVLPGMIGRSSGAVLITGSTAGHQPFPGNATYAATKAFANSFAESLHGELGGTGVTCTLLAPGPVATEFNQVAGLGKVDGALTRISVSATSTARQALEGLDKGHRTVVPGVVAKLQTVGGRYTPRSLMLPVLHRVSKGLS